LSRKDEKDDEEDKRGDDQRAAGNRGSRQVQLSDVE
jgi:hypothetical protein